MTPLSRRRGGEGAWPQATSGPESVEVRARWLRAGEDWCASFCVVGYPREVGLGWLEPLATHPGRLDVSLHVEPVAPSVAADRLRRQLARLESGRRADAARGRLADPEVDVAAEDARDLAAGLARGEQKLFRTGLTVTVHAASEDALGPECARVRALCSSLLLDAQPATWRALQGWATTLPLGVDALGARRSFDTAALAAAFPFASAELSSAGGALYGKSAKGAGLVCWDRFACDNYNSVILARSGAGKSYLAKLEALRSLYRGVEVFVVDPEDEYRRLAETVGGAYLHLGAPGARLNPFDLAAGPEALTSRALFVHTLVGVLLGGTSADEKAALDRAVLAAYESVGITADPRSHARPAPTLVDVGAALEAGPDPAAAALAKRLAPFTKGSHRGLFDGPSTVRSEGHLVVLSLRDLPEELKAAGTLLALDAAWRAVSAAGGFRRRLVVVDEAWLLMREPEGARFLFRMAKSARKRWCGLTVVTQDAADLLGSPLGQAVVSNAATQVLLRQAPQAIDALGEAFRLSEGEKAYLLGARRGEGLLVAGTERVAFQAVSSPFEHKACTSDPAELAAAEEPDL
jgi:type IV secretory pathway VirB4 component